ncbi:MAG: DUF5615 family PIN-like protein [Fimbriimonadia bacterium]|nr:DUF5615 family PIN-like protein [Fimbriimonadia bacterium]
MAKSSLKFLADENLSPVLMRILRLLGVGAAESIHGKPEQGFPDEQWIPIYAQRGYIILTLDRAQLKNSYLIQVIKQTGAKIIYLPKKFSDQASGSRRSGCYGIGKKTQIPRNH